MDRHGYRDDLRRRYSRKQQKSIGKAYGCWVIGVFVCPGLHRFYLGRRVSGMLMLGTVLAALAFAVTGLGELYSSYIGMLSAQPGAPVNPESIPKNVRNWFSLAIGCGSFAIVWAFIDLLLIPRMVRNS